MGEVEAYLDSIRAPSSDEGRRGEWRMENEIIAWLESKTFWVWVTE